MGGVKKTWISHMSLLGHFPNGTWISLDFAGDLGMKNLPNMQIDCVCNYIWVNKMIDYLFKIYFHVFLHKYALFVKQIVYLKLLMNFYHLWKNSFMEETFKNLSGYIYWKFNVLCLVHIRAFQQIRTWQRDQVHPGELLYSKVNKCIICERDNGFKERKKKWSLGHWS